MKQLTSLFDYSTDFVLATFLLLLLMFGFVVVASFSPLQIEVPQDTSVLGAQTGTFVGYIGHEDDRLSLRQITQADNRTVLELGLDTNGERYYGQDLLELTPADDKPGIYRIEMELPERYKQLSSYSIVVAGQRYPIYDDSGDKLQRDFEVEVEAGQSVPVTFEYRSVQAVNYPLEFELSVEYLGLTTLP